MLMRCISMMAWLAVLWLSSAASAQDANGQRDPAHVALVIGNAAYGQNPLVNAVNDARLVATTLREGGFDVVYAENARREELAAAVNKFSRKLEWGVIAVVYFCGHAIQYQNRNFLVPIDAKIATETDVRREAFDLDLITDSLIVVRPTGSVVILDASRANPWQRLVTDRIRGLAPQQPLQGVAFIYPAAPGKIVAESPHGAELFAAELVKAMRIPGLTFDGVLRRTRSAVTSATGGQQVPWQSAVPSNALVITPTRKPGASVGQVGPLHSADDAIESGFWNTIRNSQTSADVQAYLDAYPDGQYAGLARARLKQIESMGQDEPPGAGGRAAKPGGQTAIRDCPQCPELVLIPGGTFQMGSIEMFSFEGPVHRVSIGAPFYMGQREVTFEEWDACAAEGGCQYRPSDRGLGRGRRPVTDVDWNDAKQYADWISTKTGHAYRLPTESEWEYAARAGSNTIYPWGHSVEQDRANCLGCNHEPLNQAIKTGSFPPNAFGLFDMAGNAAEWVEDCWNETYRGAPTDGSAWTKPDCRERVLRGGSFNNDPRYLRSAARFKYDYDVRFYTNGFRVVRQP